MELKEKKISRETFFIGRVVKVHRDEVLLPNMQKSFREVVEHPGGVCIAAKAKNGNFYLVEQYRYAFQEVTLEFPAGKLEPGEDPIVSAKRELHEEIGVTSNKWTSLGTCYPTPGYCSEVIHLYYAEDLEYIGQKLDYNEFLNVREVSLLEIEDMIMSGQINDAKTICLMYRLLHVSRETK